MHTVVTVQQLLTTVTGLDQKCPFVGVGRGEEAWV